MVRYAPSAYALAKRRRIGSKTYRAARSIGAFAWHNRASILKMARSFKRRKAKKPSFSTRNVGDRVGRSNAKKFTVVDTTQDIATRTQYGFEITAIPQTTAIDTRERQVINLRGFKFCIQLQNLSDKPMVYHVAIVAPKSSVDTLSPDSFFRGTGDTRGIDFDNNLNANDFRCRGINTDKYTILKHKRIYLKELSTGATGITNGFYGASGYSYRTADMYVPLRRQLRYEKDQVGCQNGAVYFVHWCDTWDSQALSPVVPDQAKITMRVLTYFRETRT